MNLIQIAIINQTDKINADDFSEAVSAIQKQVSRDFSPIWGVNASIAAFSNAKKVPLGYWSIFILDDINQPGAAGFHTDENHQPYAMVQYSDSWTLTLSHETLEMLADPFGSRLVAANSIEPNQGRVQYLLEVCDPSESEDYAYSINGVMVSDFYTPHFFDPVVSSSVRYSFSGKITKPMEVLPGGYLSWYYPEKNEWWQATYFGNEQKFKKLNGMHKQSGSLRSRIDKLTQVPHLLEGVANVELLSLYSKRLENNRAASESMVKTMYSAFIK